MNRIPSIFLQYNPASPILVITESIHQNGLFGFLSEDKRSDLSGFQGVDMVFGEYKKVYPYEVFLKLRQQEAIAHSIF